MKKIVKISFLLCISSLIYSFTAEQEAKIQHYVVRPEETEGFWNSLHKAVGTEKGTLMKEADRRRNSSLVDRKEASVKDSNISKNSSPRDSQKLTNNVAGSGIKSDSLKPEKNTFKLNEAQDNQETKKNQEASLVQKEKNAQLEAKKTKSTEAEKVVVIDSFDTSNQNSPDSKKTTKTKTKDDAKKIDLNSLSKLLKTDSQDILENQKKEIDASLQAMLDASAADPAYNSYNEFLQKNLNEIPGKFVKKFFEKFDQNISVSTVASMSLESIQYIPKNYFEKQDQLYKDTKTPLPVFDQDKQLFIDIVKKGIESVSPKDIESMDSKTREIFVKNLLPENTQKLSADQIKKILHDQNAQNSLKVKDLSPNNLIDALTKGTITGRSEISLTKKFQSSMSRLQLKAILKVPQDQLRLSESDLKGLKTVYGALRRQNVDHL